jgi:predicted nucleotidyltransferase
MPMMNNSPSLREYDFIEHEGNIYRVLGNIHPPDYYVVSIRYHFDSQERRYKKVKKYGTMMQDPQVLTLYGSILKDIPWYDIKAGVYLPQAKDKVFFPDNFYSELKSRSNIDKITRKCKEFGNYLENKVGIPEDSIGVTGSILLNLHTKSSDIDIIIYGQENCHKMIDHLKNNEKITSSQYKITSWEKSSMARAFYTRIENQSSTTTEDLKARLMYSLLEKGGAKIDIHYIKSKNPSDYVHSPKILNSSKFLEFDSMVIDTRDSIHFPGSIEITEMKILSEESKYTGGFKLLFFDKSFHFLKKGDRIHFKGRFFEISPSKEFFNGIDSFFLARELIKCTVSGGG